MELMNIEQHKSQPFVAAFIEEKQMDNGQNNINIKTDLDNDEFIIHLNIIPSSIIKKKRGLYIRILTEIFSGEFFIISNNTLDSTLTKHSKSQNIHFHKEYYTDNYNGIMRNTFSLVCDCCDKINISILYDSSITRDSWILIPNCEDDE
jgi:hypothetical protein